MEWRKKLGNGEMEEKNEEKLNLEMEKNTKK
jgi:hypothetical protein